MAFVFGFYLLLALLFLFEGFSVSFLAILLFLDFELCQLVNDSAIQLEDLGDELLAFFVLKRSRLHILFELLNLLLVRVDSVVAWILTTGGRCMGGFVRVSLLRNLFRLFFFRDRF